MDFGAMHLFVAYQEDTPPANLALYQSLVGSLNYLETQTRPDIVIAFTASVLSRFLHSPSLAQVKAAKRVLQYLRRMPKLGVQYSWSSQLNQLISYSDVNYDGCQDSRRSTSGYVFFVSNGPVSWSSKRQAIVTMSSSKAEYNGINHAAGVARKKLGHLLSIVANHLPRILYGLYRFFGWCAGTVSITLGQRSRFVLTDSATRKIPNSLLALIGKYADMDKVSMQAHFGRIE
jgi:hypothetical protein